MVILQKRWLLGLGFVGVVIVLSIGMMKEITSEKKEVSSQEKDDIEEVREIVEEDNYSNKESVPSEYDDISLPALMERKFNGRDLSLDRVVRETSLYTEYFITYTSGDFTISGILNIPKGEVPEGGFPVLFLNHGYIDPAVYTNGRGLRREQDYLARQGFAILHSDYRNHAQSDKDESNEVSFRLGYVEDVINAVEAVKNSDREELSKTRFGMLGHSMGGGIAQTIMVVRPDLVQAFVLYAPVSSDARENYERWTSRRFETAQYIKDTYGLPEESPLFWDQISPNTFFDRVQSPVMIFHGTNDESCDIAWSRQSRDTLLSFGKDVSLVEYENEKHEFGPQHRDFMQSSSQFFKENL